MTKDNTHHSDKANNRDKTRDKYGVKAQRQKARRNKQQRRKLETGNKWK